MCLSTTKKIQFKETILFQKDDVSFNYALFNKFSHDESRIFVSLSTIIPSSLKDNNADTSLLINYILSIYRREDMKDLTMNLEVC